MSTKKAERKQCPTCGHINRDWSCEGKVTDEAGRKIDSLDLPDKKEDRGAAYAAFRRPLGLGVVMDFDQVEYRRDANGDLVPAALLELTRVDGNIPVPKTYLAAILARYQKRDRQSQLVCEGARRLGTTAWIVAFRHDLTEFWIYNLSDERGWWSGDQKWYVEFLEGLKAYA